MLRMEITFNTGKIQKENVLKIEDLYLRLDQAIHALGLKKVDDGVYEDNGNKEDLTKFFAVISWLKKSEWFRQCVIQQPEQDSPRLQTLGRIATKTNYKFGTPKGSKQ